jgi:hypothetical protein
LKCVIGTENLLRTGALLGKPANVPTTLGAGHIVRDVVREIHIAVVIYIAPARTVFDHRAVTVAGIMLASVPVW